MLKVMKRAFMPTVILTTLLIYVATTNVAAMPESPKEVDLTINHETITMKTNAKTIEEVLISVDYEHKDTDKINYELDDRLLEEMAIVVSSEKEVTLSVKGGNIEATTNANTVADLLKELDIEVSNDDIVIPSLDSKLNEKEEIVIIYHETEVYKESSNIDYKVNEKFSFDIPYGETKVVQEGENGVFEKTYKKVSKNGIVVSNEMVSEKVVKEPVDKEVLIGTKEIVNEEISNGTIEKGNPSMFQGESKVVQAGNKGNEQSIFKNDGENRELVSKKITQEPVDRIVEKGTKIKPKPEVKKTSASYSLRDLKFHGVINNDGRKYTYYSQATLPGGGLKIPGRHVNSGGYVADSNGYIVVAANRGIPKGTVINTPFGYQGKVYDMCASCSPNWYDIYTK